MAVGYISYQGVETNGDRSGSASITIPATATVVCVLGVTYYTSGAVLNPVCHIGANNFTQVATAGGSSSYNWTLLEYAKTSVVGTGAKTLSWDFGWTPGYYIGYFIVVYLSGTDATNPILDSGSAWGADDVTGLDTDTGCMIVGAVGSDVDPTVTGDSQQSIAVVQCAGGARIGAAYEANEGDWYSSGTSYPSAVAAVFKASAGASSTPIYHIMNQ